MKTIFAGTDTVKSTILLKKYMNVTQYKKQKVNIIMIIIPNEFK